MERKSDLRRAVLARRDALGPQELAKRSAAAGARLLSLPDLQGAWTVMFFVAFGSEVDTLPMIVQALAAGKRVLAPRADPSRRRLLPCQVRDPAQDFAPGAHNIREPNTTCLPVPLDEIEVVVVPAAVWGEDGYRIGYGGGYYDRFLSEVPGATKVGLGLEVQVVSSVPHGEHDLPVDLLVTEERVRRFAPRERGR
jgi:5-formyltetrahydrofolate cyclo-ligase